MSTFSRSFLQELERRTVLSDVIGRSVTLKRQGREFSGLCPFHKEKTPSFTVNDDKGFYHCFGCGAHGDAIEFLHKHEGLPFVQAVEQLAAAAGLPIEKSSPEERRVIERGDRLARLCEAACHWFHRQLSSKDGEKARDYLRQRAMDEDSMRRFRLGFAPGSSDALTREMEHQGFSLDDMLEAGILLRPEGSATPYPRFRRRIIFPIQDLKGRVCGFGGRLIDGEGPKYLNSPQTPIFAKARLLYGFPQGLESARRKKSVIVVEGYLDVIALHQSGIRHAVAPLGTALSEDHLHILWRCADTPICCFDGDEAGRRAAGKACERALPILRAGRSLQFAFLPEGEDPDSFLRGQGIEAWKALMGRTTPMADFLWESHWQRKRPKAPEDWAALHSRLYALATTIRMPAIQREYLHFFRRRQDQARSAPTLSRWRRPPWRRRESAPFATPVTEIRAEQKNTPGDGRRSNRSRIDVSYGEMILAQCLTQPSLIGACAEDLNRIELGRPDLIRLREDVLALGQEETDGEKMQERLNRKGYGPMIEALRQKERIFFVTPKGKKAQTPEERLKILIKLLHDRQAPKITREVFHRQLPDQRKIRRHRKERLRIRRELDLLDDSKT